MQLRRLSFVVLCLVLSACARANSIFREKPITDPATAIAVDAKQRFLVSNEQKPDEGKATEEKKYTKEGEKEVSQNTTTPQLARFRKICLEPSPDVFSVLTSALDGNAKYGDKVAAGLKAAISESGATIGIRTETIQLLRDAMYRICELGLNGDLDAGAALELHRRYQRSMVTLAAVAALADVAKPSQIALGGDAHITQGSLNADLNNAIEEATAERDGKKKESEAAVNELAAAVAAVCELTVDANADCVKDASACQPKEAPDGKPLCQSRRSDPSVKDSDQQMAEAYCKDKNAAECAAVASKKGASDEAGKALEHAETALKQLEEERDDVETSSDVSVVSRIVAIPRSPQASSKDVQAVADVVGNMVTQVYAEDRLADCMKVVSAGATIATEGAKILKGIASVPGEDDVSAVVPADFGPHFNALNRLQMSKLYTNQLGSMQPLIDLCTTIASTLGKEINEAKKDATHH